MLSNDRSRITKWRVLFGRLLVVSLIAVIVVTGLLSWFGVVGGERTERVALDDAKAVALRDSVLTAQAAFEAALRKGNPSPAVVERLQDAVEKHREWMRLTALKDSQEDERLRTMERALEKVGGIDAKRASKEAEAVAEALLETKQTAEAIVKFREALDMQIVINRMPASASLRDIGRELELARRISTLEVEPLVALVEERISAGQRELDAKNWPAAIAAYQGAHEAQSRINREFSRTTHASTLKLADIEQQLASLGTAETFVQIEEFLRSARAARKAGDYEGALRFLDQAMERQSTINRDFPRSRFASVEGLQKLAAEKQTFASELRMQAIHALEKNINRLLSLQENDEAVKKIAEATVALDQLTAEFPKSRLLSLQQRLRFSYLNLLKGDLDKINRTLATAFAPVPGESGVRMFRGEVSQEFFELVMSSNPSRNRAPKNSVDSVRWTDAADFCQRIEWVTGKKVRLPKLEEFLAAMGHAKADGVALEKIATFQLREIASSEANASGFSNLEGGLAEWLDGSLTDAEMTFVGTSEKTGNFVQVKFARYESAAFLGFRVVIVDE